MNLRHYRVTKSHFQLDKFPKELMTELGAPRPTLCQLKPEDVNGIRGCEQDMEAVQTIKDWEDCGLCKERFAFLQFSSVGSSVGDAEKLAVRRAIEREPVPRRLDVANCAVCGLLLDTSRLVDNGRCVHCDKEREAFVAGFFRAAVKFSLAPSLEQLDREQRDFGKSLKEQAEECWHEHIKSKGASS